MGGYVTLEISTTPLPARIYANEGIAQVLLGDEDCGWSRRQEGSTGAARGHPAADLSPIPPPLHGRGGVTPVRKGRKRSIGTGKMVVELFSVATSARVCR